MTLLIDAAPLVALADRKDPLRSVVREVLEAEPGTLVIAAPVTTEADYLLGQRIGQAARLAFLEDLAAGRFVVECLEPAEYAEVIRLEHHYLDLKLGLADCATVLLAARLRTRRVLTFDAHHFRTVRPLQGAPSSCYPVVADRHAHVGFAGGCGARGGTVSRSELDTAADAYLAELVEEIAKLR